MNDSSTEKVVLVTGATGFVGANLARRLVLDGHKVHLLVRNKSNQLPWRITEIKDQVKLDYYTPSEPDSVDRVFAEAKPQWVFHLAAHGAYSWQQDKAQILESNYLLTSRLLDAAVEHGCESFVNTGTSSEYGQKDHAPKRMSHSIRLATMLPPKQVPLIFAALLVGAHNINMPTLRLYSCFGPYEQPNRLMTNLVACGNRTLNTTFVDENCAHDFVYVEDAVDAYILAAKRKLSANSDPGAIYNVGTGVQTTLKEVVGIAAPLMNIDAKPTFGSMQNRSWDAEVWVCDHTRITEELGWRPQHRFCRRAKRWSTGIANPPICILCIRITCSRFETVTAFGALWFYYWRIKGARISSPDCRIEPSTPCF